MSLQPARLKPFVARMKRDALAMWFALHDARTPWTAKAVAALALLYLLSPIDPIPDFIPVVGLLDELVVLPLLVGLASRLLPAPVMQDCRAQADAWLAQRRPKPRWAAGAVLVVLTWTLLAWLGWRWWQAR